MSTRSLYSSRHTYALPYCDPTLLCMCISLCFNWCTLLDQNTCLQGNSSSVGPLANSQSDCKYISTMFCLFMRQRVNMCIAMVCPWGSGRRSTHMYSPAPISCLFNHSTHTPSGVLTCLPLHLSSSLTLVLQLQHISALVHSYTLLHTYGLLRPSVL